MVPDEKEIVDILQRPKKKRAGFTTNKGNKRNKRRAKMSRQSRRINRRN